MFIYGAGVLAVRRAAGENREQVVILPGPPLWRLLLEELAHTLTQQWKRLRRVFGRESSSSAGV